MFSSSPLYVTFSELPLSPASLFLRTGFRRNERTLSILLELSHVTRI
jgi:hypothetical protein